MPLILTERNGVQSLVEESTLIRSEGMIDNENERTTWVEYRDMPDGEIVHRSVHVHLKTGLLLESGIGGF